MKKLNSFHGDKKFKAELVKDAINHRKQDMFIKGAYEVGSGKEFKGCSVGCTIHTYSVRHKKDLSNSSHAVFESEFEIPVALAYLNDRFFERLPIADSMSWPERFFKACPVGVDLTKAAQAYFIWAIGDPKHGLASISKEPQDKQLFFDFAGMLQKDADGVKISDEEFKTFAARFPALFDALFDARFAALFDARFPALFDALFDARCAALFAARFAAEIKISSEKLLEFIRNCK